MVASRAKGDRAALAALLGHRACSGERLNACCTWKSLTIIAKVRQQRWNVRFQATYRRLIPNLIRIDRFYPLLRVYYIQVARLGWP